MYKDELEDAFFTEVLIDTGYVSLGPWEVSNVDTDANEITLTRNES